MSDRTVELALNALESVLRHSSQSMNLNPSPSFPSIPLISFLPSPFLLLRPPSSSFLLLSSFHPWTIPPTRSYKTQLIPLLNPPSPISSSLPQSEANASTCSARYPESSSPIPSRGVGAVAHQTWCPTRHLSRLEQVNLYLPLCLFLQSYLPFIQPIPLTLSLSLSLSFSVSLCFIFSVCTVNIYIYIHPCFTLLLPVSYLACHVRSCSRGYRQFCRKLHSRQASPHVPRQPRQSRLFACMPTVCCKECSAQRQGRES
jgi:hypothetical protein